MDDDDRESFGDCVEREIAEDLVPELGCIPPWLSQNNQCNGIIEHNSKLWLSFYAKGAVYENYTNPSLMYDQNKAGRTLCSNWGTSIRFDSWHGNVA